MTTVNMKVVGHAQLPNGCFEVTLEALDQPGVRGGIGFSDRIVLTPRGRRRTPIPSLETVVEVENLGQDGCRVRWDDVHIEWTDDAKWRTVEHHGPNE